MEEPTSLTFKLRLWGGNGLPRKELECLVKNDEQNKKTSAEWLRRWLERNRSWLYHITKDAGEESVAIVYEDNIATEVRLTPKRDVEDFSFLSDQENCKTKISSNPSQPRMRADVTLNHYDLHSQKATPLSYNEHIWDSLLRLKEAAKSRQKRFNHGNSDRMILVVKVKLSTVGDAKLSFQRRLHVDRNNTLGTHVAQLALVKDKRKKQAMREVRSPRRLHKKATSRNSTPTSSSKKKSNLSGDTVVLVPQSESTTAGASKKKADSAGEVTNDMAKLNATGSKTPTSTPPNRKQSSKRTRTDLEAAVESDLQNDDTNDMTSREGAESNTPRITPPRQPAPKRPRADSETPVVSTKTDKMPSGRDGLGNVAKTPPKKPLTKKSAEAANNTTVDKEAATQAGKPPPNQMKKPPARRKGAVAELANHCNVPDLTARDKFEKGFKAMDRITETPYDDDSTAEVGEELFEETKSLLKLKEGTGRRKEATDKANQILGKELARSIVVVRNLVAISKVIYSLHWKDGKIGSSTYTNIEPWHLLVCLQGFRLGGVGADVRLTSQIINDLGVFPLVKEAIEQWKLQESYVNLDHCNGNYDFRNRRLDCQKCAIFVARAYSMFKLIKWKSPGKSLMMKINDCLEIMDSGVPPKPPPSPEVTEESESSPMKEENDNDSTTSAESTESSTVGSTTGVAVLQKVSCKTDEVVESFPSISAASSARHVSLKSIEDAIRRGNKSGHRFYWRWSKESSDTTNSDDEDDEMDITAHGTSTSHEESPEKPIVELGPEIRYRMLVDPEEIQGKGDEWMDPNPNPFVISPYEESYNAETGEKLFVEWKNLVAQGAVQLVSKLGKSMGSQVACSAEEIAMSDDIYKPMWKDGKSEGGVNTNKFISGPLLLTVLRDEKFCTVDSNDKALWRIVNDLKLSNIVDEALNTWNLRIDFEYLTESVQSTRIDCQKCAIFVSRTFRIMKTLRIATMSVSLFRKVMHCCEIMNKSRANGRLLKERFAPAHALQVSCGGSLASSQMAGSNQATKKRKGNERPVAQIVVRTEPGSTSDLLEEGDLTPTAPSERVSKPGSCTRAGQKRGASLITRPDGRFDSINAGNELCKDRFGGRLSTIAEEDSTIFRPYEKRSNAENGERVFDEMKKLLIPPGDNIEASPKAIGLFGPDVAKSMVRTRAQVVNAPILFSLAWLAGTICGVDCGRLSKQNLLLCLQSKLFRKIKDNDKVICGLGVYEIVRNVIEDWGLQDRYVKLSNHPMNYTFSSYQSQCHRCAIFVARAYSCVKALKVGIDDSLKEKVNSCLSTMEKYVEEYKDLAYKPNQPKIANVANQGRTGATPRNSRVVDRNNQENVEPDMVSVPERLRGSVAQVRNVATNELNNIAARNDQDRQMPGQARPPREPKESNDARVDRLLKEVKASPSAEEKWIIDTNEETYLNSIENELAYLCEESMYCLRQKQIEWRFICKYASPDLTAKLEETFGTADVATVVGSNDGSISDCDTVKKKKKKKEERRQKDKQVLERLVRTDDVFVKRRFEVKRKKIRREMYTRKYYRPKLMDVVLEMRKSSSTSRSASISRNGSNFTNVDDFGKRQSLVSRIEFTPHLDYAARQD